MALAKGRRQVWLELEVTEEALLYSLLEQYQARRRPEPWWREESDPCGIRALARGVKAPGGLNAPWILEDVMSKLRRPKFPQIEI